MVHIYYRFTNASLYGNLHEEAYRMLCDAMKKDFGIDTNRYLLCHTEQGKPYLQDCSYRFSVTHTEGLVAVAIASFEVGLDAEPINRVLKPKTAKRFLQKESCDIWDWVRYESIGKLIGVGIPFSEEELKRGYTTKNCTSIEGYAVCCASNEADFSFRTIHI